jgi:hypothetical protein
MTKQILILMLVVILVIITPVQAFNITYPQEYYELGKMVVDKYINGIAWTSDGRYTVTELHRQNILIEKQNELIAERNEILRNRTVLRCIDYYSMVGVCSAWGWQAL